MSEAAIIRDYPAYPSNNCGEQACSKRLLRTDYWDRRLSQVRKNESLTHTERILHRIFRCLGVYLAKYLGLFVKRIHLRLHKLRLNFDYFLEILGLAKSLHERKRSSDILRRIAQKYSVQISVTPRKR
jgi:hypothetical protein